MKCKECDAELISKDYRRYRVTYCPVCFNYRKEQQPCRHNFRLILYNQPDGSQELRNTCYSCFQRAKPIKPILSAGVDLSKVRVSNEECYLEVIEGKDRELQSDIEDLRTKKWAKKRSVYNHNHREYMKSEEWFAIRDSIFKRDGYHCRICGNEAKIVHHLTYDHFTHEFEFELISLCHDCHMNEFHPHKKIRYYEDVYQQSS